MANWVVISSVLSLVLAGLAIYEHVRSASLMLPLTPITITTTILPFLAAFNAIYRPRRARSASTTTFRHLASGLLQALQALLTTILATLLLFATVPSATRQCLLSTTWQRLFSAHDSNSIRRIQDALNCCGFNTVRDRAWPFPGRGQSRECSEIYGRTTSCGQPWQVAMQQSSGVDLGVVLAIGVLQIVTLFLFENLDPFQGFTLGGRRIFSQRTESDPERARLLSGVVGAIDNRDGSGDEAEQADHGGTENGRGISGRGTDPCDTNPWGR